MFSSETRLVLVPFHVVRGLYFAPDVKPEDVLLLEDGKPRDFTVFEGPGTGRRPPLELTLLFDTTTLPPPNAKRRVVATHWDREATYDFTSHWGDVESRAVLERGGADVRVSVYRFDRQQLQRLCRSTSDAPTLTGAIRRLPESIPPDEAVPLTLPDGRKTYEQVASERFGKLDPNAPIRWPISWTLEAAIATVKDTNTAPKNALRVLALFSEMTGMTTTTPEDAADQANPLGISIYPVVLDLEKYKREPFELMRRRDSEWAAENPHIDRLIKLGELTGGEGLSPSQLDATVVINILNVIRNRALSQYIIGFAPSSSEGQRAHKLEVRLKSKSTGKLLANKRTAVY